MGRPTLLVRNHHMCTTMYLLLSLAKRSNANLCSVHSQSFRASRPRISDCILYDSHSIPQCLLLQSWRYNLDRQGATKVLAPVDRLLVPYHLSVNSSRLI